MLHAPKPKSTPGCGKRAMLFRPRPCSRKDEKETIVGRKILHGFSKNFEVFHVTASRRTALFPSHEGFCSCL